MEANPKYSLEGLMLKHQYWPLDAKSLHIVANPDAEKDQRQEEKGTTENEMSVWHH